MPKIFSVSLPTKSGNRGNGAKSVEDSLFLADFAVTSVTMRKKVAGPRIIVSSLRQVNLSDDGGGSSPLVQPVISQA